MSEFTIKEDTAHFVPGTSKGEAPKASEVIDDPACAIGEKTYASFEDALRDVKNDEVIPKPVKPDCS